MTETLEEKKNGLVNDLGRTRAGRSPSILGRVRHHIGLISAITISVGVGLKGLHDGFQGYVATYKEIVNYFHPTSDGTSIKPAAPQLVNSGSAATERLSLVVLPFSFIGPTDKDYLAESVTNDLISALSRINGSFVISRNTSNTYKGKAVDIKRVADELGVHYVLEGSLQKEGQRYRIDARLVEAEQGKTIWSDQIDGERPDFLALQNEIVTRIGLALNIQFIKANASQIARQKISNPDALDLIALGWSSILKPRSKPNIEAAIKNFQAALNIDNKNPDAMSGLATALAINYTLGWSNNPEQETTKASSLIEAALAADSQNAAAYFARGWLYKTGRPLEAISAYEETLNINPNFPDAARLLAESYMWAGRPQKAIDANEKFLKLSPRDPNLGIVTWVTGYSLLLQGRPAEALPYLVKARVLNPRAWFIHFVLTSALALNGDLQEARASLVNLQKLRPDMTSVSVYYRVPKSPAFRALAKNTLDAGLERAGLPLDN